MRRVSSNSKRSPHHKQQSSQSLSLSSKTSRQSLSFLPTQNIKMLFSNIILLAGLAAALPNPIEEDTTLETRDAGGIDLLKLRVSKKATFKGVGVPGRCNNFPSNIKTFDLDSPDTKSILSCFECTVWTRPGCQGDSVTLEGQRAFFAKSSKKPTYKSWKCQCKGGC